MHTILFFFKIEVMQCYYFSSELKLFQNLSRMTFYMFHNDLPDYLVQIVNLKETTDHNNNGENPSLEEDKLICSFNR